MLDIFTIIDKKQSLKDLKVAIIGDIYHSREKNIWGMSKLGAKICVAGPSTLMPPELEKAGVKVLIQFKKL